MTFIPTIGAQAAFSDVNPDGSLRPLDVGEVRDWALAMEYLVKVLGLAGGPLYYLTLGDLFANTTAPATQGAIVWADGTVANNGIYKSTGLGGWTRLMDLPFDKFIVATNAGGGTANAIEASTPHGIPTEDGGALVALPIVATNTASPVTAAFDGGSALTIKNGDGTDVLVSSLKAGEVIWGYKSGGTFRLTRDKPVYVPCTTASAADPNTLMVNTPHGLPTTPRAALVAVPIENDNTASPVGIFFDGVHSYFVKTSSGADIAPGGLKGGTTVLGMINDSGFFQLLSNQATAAIQDACEAAQVAAETARDEAVAAAASAKGTGSVFLRYDYLNNVWFVHGPAGETLDISGSLSGGINECLAICKTYGYPFDIVGGATSASGDGPNEIISVAEQLLVPTMRFWSWRMRGVTLDFGMLDDDAMLLNSLGNFEIDFAASQFVYRGSNAAMRLWPKDTVPGDPTTGIGIGRIKFPASIAVYGNGSRCIRITPTIVGGVAGQIGACSLLFGELNGGMTDGGGSPADTVAIQVDQAALNFGVYNVDFIAAGIHGCGATAVQIGAEAQSSLGCINGNWWKLLGSTYPGQTFLKTYGWRDTFNLSIANNGTLGTTGFELATGAKGNKLIVANNDAVTPYVDNSGETNIIITDDKIIGGTRSFLGGGTGDTGISPGTTVYIGEGSFGTTAAAWKKVLPFAAKALTLRVKSHIDPGSGESYTFTLMKNGVATGLVAAITGGNTSAMDAGSIAFDPGDDFSVRAVSSSGAAAGAVLAYGLELGY